MVWSLTSPSSMSFVWLHNIEQRAVLRMQLAILKFECIRKRVVDDRWSDSMLEVIDRLYTV